MDGTIRSHLSKKSLPILLSISAFSVMFSFSFLPINVISNQILGYITDRNYIFLFCNGILVLIIKSSGLASNSPPNSETIYEFVEKRVDHVQPVVELAENKAECREVVTVESEQKQEQEVRVYENLGEDEDEYVYEIEGEDEYVYEDEDEDEDEDDLLVSEEDGFGLLTTEELNKKCDEFIRKMRKGINIQA